MHILQLALLAFETAVRVILVVGSDRRYQLLSSMRIWKDREGCDFPDTTMIYRNSKLSVHFTPDVG